MARDEAALVVGRGLDGLAADAIESGADARSVLKRIENDVPTEGAGELTATGLADLIGLEADGELTATQAKQVLGEMVASGRAPADIAADLGFEAVDTDALDGIVDQVIADNPDEWARFEAGDDAERGKLTGFFVGQVMKATQGNADGKAVTAALRSRV